MKKYIIPALRIADINNETLLAGSERFDTSSATGISTGRLGARERNNYDFEDDFEEDFEE